MATLDVTRLNGTSFNGSIDPDSGQLTLEGTRITVDHFRFEGNLEDAERAGLLAGATDTGLDVAEGADRVAELADGDDAAATTPDPELPSANYARPDSYANGVYAEAASAEEVGEGMKGEHVRARQQELADAGYDLGEHGVDGFWGPDTQAAWTDYQANGGRPMSEVDADDDTTAPDRARQHEVMQDAYDAQADTVTATDAPEFSLDADARTLRVDGTGEGDRMRLSYDAEREAYDLNYTNADGEESLLTSVPGADLDRVEIAGRGGDDTIFLDPSLNDAARRLEIGAGGNAGDDVILNAADGATLVDGDGNDRYLNSGDGVTIGQYRPGVGEAPVTGSDAVLNAGDDAHISFANDGDHLVMSEGDDARIVLGDGDNLVATQGERNRVLVGDGNNVVRESEPEEELPPITTPIEL